MEFKTTVLFFLAVFPLICTPGPDILFMCQTNSLFIVDHLGQLAPSGSRIFSEQAIRPLNRPSPYFSIHHFLDTL